MTVTPIASATPGVYVLDHEFGIHSFKLGKMPGQYIATLEPKDTVKTHADLIALQNETSEWMFLNTNAVLLEGNIRKDKTALATVIEGTRACKLVDRGSYWHGYIPIGQWAKAIGIDVAIGQLNASGQTDKAAKLNARRPK